MIILCCKTKAVCCKLHFIGGLVLYVIIDQRKGSSLLTMQYGNPYELPYPKKSKKVSVVYFQGFVGLLKNTVLFEKTFVAKWKRFTWFPWWWQRGIHVNLHILEHTLSV